MITTARCQITLQPDFPAPGPNSVSWVRCRPEEVASLIDEVHRAVAPRRLPLMWVLGPSTEPSDLGSRLAEHGIRPAPGDPEVAVMVLPAQAQLEVPQISGLEIRDALVDGDTFRQAISVATAAFGANPEPDSIESRAQLERRRLHAQAAGNRHQLLALVDGVPAGTGGLTLYPPIAGTINGGSVLREFRGRGVYRALVAARLEIARSAGVEGLTVWGGDLSAPILSRLGFTKVGWRRFYLDKTTL